jgi:diadenosine tetraphosphate (Ap4A) HIT family hydrolase
MTKGKALTKKENCIFCKIAAKEIMPLGEGIIFEDAKYLAWLSPFPNTEGFAVVIPKKHYTSDVLAMPNKKLQEFVLTAKKVSQLLLSF